MGICGTPTNWILVLCKVLRVRDTMIVCEDKAMAETVTKRPDLPNCPACNASRRWEVIRRGKGRDHEIRTIHYTWCRIGRLVRQMKERQSDGAV